MSSTPITVLRIDSSGRHNGSQTRALTDKVVARLGTLGAKYLITRDLAGGIEYVDEDWINANFTPEQNRTEAQTARLSSSDILVSDLERSDVVVIGVPIYNFGIPAVLKAWIDQVARARKTFRYTDNGPVGLLTGKKAILVVASGGVEVGSDYDFATSYLKHVLGFIGITDVTIIAADEPGASEEEKRTIAEQKINVLIASQTFTSLGSANA